MRAGVELNNYVNLQEGGEVAGGSELWLCLATSEVPQGKGNCLERVTCVPSTRYPDYLPTLHCTVVKCSALK